MKYAFRCVKCGHLHTAADAAEADHPHCCKVCGSGVTFTPSGRKQTNPGNWEILAEVPPERLTELGLTAEQVETHHRWARGENREPASHQVTASDGPGVTDGAG